MGNWRTVNITGSMDPREAKDMIDFLTYGDNWSKWDTDAAPLLINESLCGLNQWVSDNGTIDAIGNLAERDFDNGDIEKALIYLAQKYPSMKLTLHSGSNWEELQCTATFHVEGGVVRRCEPEVEMIHAIPEGQGMMRLMKILGRV